MMEKFTEFDWYSWVGAKAVGTNGEGPMIGWAEIPQGSIAVLADGYGVGVYLHDADDNVIDFRGKPGPWPESRILAQALLAGEKISPEKIWDWVSDPEHGWS